MARNGHVYTMRKNGTILNIDITNGRYSWVGKKRTSSVHISVGRYFKFSGWGNGILGNDGSVYWPPYHAQQVLKYNTETDAISLIGDAYYPDRYGKWSGSCLAPDGAINSIPGRTYQTLRIDPFRSFAKILEANIGRCPEKFGFLF